MTAFTYRFAPALRYLTKLCKDGELGELRHFRSQRFLDWPETSWGWRQYKATAGAGNLYDMTSHRSAFLHSLPASGCLLPRSCCGCPRLLSQHDFAHPALLPCRIDFAQDIMGPIESITGSIATFCPRDKNPDGTDCAPSEVDDWTALIGRFKNGATGVWEGSTVMKGYKFGGFGKEWAEVNGSVATAVYQMGDPNNLLFGKHGESLGASRQPLRSLRKHSRAAAVKVLTSVVAEPIPVPPEFLVWGDSPRDPTKGKPSAVFRHDVIYELTTAIVEDRAAVPSFKEGAMTQMVRAPAPPRAMGPPVNQCADCGLWLMLGCGTAGRRCDDREL